MKVNDDGSYMSVCRVAFDEGLFEPKSVTWCVVFAVFICLKTLLKSVFFLNSAICVSEVQYCCRLRPRWLVPLPSDLSGRSSFNVLVVES